MTLEVDSDRAAGVTSSLRRHRDTVLHVREHLHGLGRRMDLGAGGRGSDVASGVAATVAVVDEVMSGLDSAAWLIDRVAEQARRADLGGPHTSFAGGTAVCSAIQVFSPVPSRPSTSGTTGMIDAGGVATDAGSLAATAAAPALLAGRSVPLLSIAAAFADALMCRLRVGSGAGISTRRVVDDDGDEVFEGSRSDQPYMTSTGEPLDPDPVVRDRQMWRAEHRNEQGLVTDPYPGFPAYEVNAPSR